MCPLIHFGVCLDADCVVLIMLGWLCCVGCVDWTGCAAGCAVPVMLCWADYAVTVVLFWLCWLSWARCVVLTALCCAGCAGCVVLVVLCWLRCADCVGLNGLC